MSTFVFPRRSYTQLWLTLRSDETLGILDSDYLEDYYGVDGQITLYHVPTTNEYSVLMSDVPSETPEIPFDVFRGAYSPLSNLPDGLYELRFRCKDVLGNYTISNSVQSPFGGERILSLNLEIVPFVYGYVYVEGPVIARGSFVVDLSRAELPLYVAREQADANVSRETPIADMSRDIPSVDVQRTSVYVELT